MISLPLWAGAGAFYLLFLAWHRNWRPPLSAAEVDGVMRRLAELGRDPPDELERVRAFLAQDDGRPFLMLNLVRVAPGTTADPVDGRATSGRELMRRYAQGFMPLLLRHGGHPALAARKVGGYLDAWRVPADPGWSVVGLMRYRSRRDMAALILDPRFRAIHPYKAAGTAETFSFPVQPEFTALSGPPVWAALLIALLAALAQIGLLLNP